MKQAPAQRRALWPWLARAAWHARLDATLAALICLVDAAITSYGTPLGAGTRWTAVLSAAGLGAWLGGAIGVLQGLALELSSRLPSPLAVETRFDEGLNPTAVDRSAVVRLHAWTFSWLLYGAVAILGFAAFHASADRIKEPELRSVLIVLVAAVGVVSTLVLAGLTLPLAERLIGAIDRRVRLPLPRGAVVRFSLFAVVPTAAVAAWLFGTYGVKLGVFMHVLGAAVFVVLTRWLALIWLGAERVVDGRRGFVWRALRYTSCALPVVVAAFALIALQLHDGAAQRVRRGAVLPFMSDFIQSATDWDRDGASALFGGRDCASFDRTRSPLAQDLPDNGKDENCDGKDSIAGEGLPPVERFSGTLPQGKAQRFNVLWYIVDSLRADHLPVYGYSKNTSPTLTRLASESWVFERVYSQSSNTSLSVPSMMHGRWPSSLAWRRSYYPVAADSEHLLPAILNGQGYFTALVMNDWVQHKLPGIQHGFGHRFIAPEAVNWKSGEALLSLTLGAMEQARQAEQPFFVVMHIDDVHHPYVAHRGHALPEFPNPDRAIQNYDKGIALFDQSLSFMLAHLETQGLDDDTIVIVTADHGEEFLEHGGTIHSRTCYVESVRVPLVMRVPGQKAARVKNRVALVDITPTLLELLGLERASPNLDGQSLLVPLTRPELVDAERPLFCSIFQMLGGRQNFFTHTVRSGRWLMVHEMLSDAVELYDTEKDPTEHQNLAARPEYAADVERLKQWGRASFTGNLFEARTFQ